MRSARSKEWSDVIRTGLFAAAGLLVVVMAAYAQTGEGQAVQPEQAQTKEQEKHFLYEWTDNKGVVHVTDRPDKVPERYRSTVRQIQAPPEGGKSLLNSPLPRLPDIPKGRSRNRKQNRRHPGSSACREQSSVLPISSSSTGRSIKNGPRRWEDGEALRRGIWKIE